MKRMLILKMHHHICGEEMGLVKLQAELLGLTVSIEEIVDAEILEIVFDRYGQEGTKFDYVYLCSHGNASGFEIDMGAKHDMSWVEFGLSACKYNVFNEDTVFLLACCRGGLFQVAMDLFAVCPQISFVCGVKWTLKSSDLATGFVVFLYSMIQKKAEPGYAAQKASLATDYSFVCHDRAEIESNPQFAHHQFRVHYELGWIDSLGNSIDLPEEQSQKEISEEKIKGEPAPLS